MGWKFFPKGYGLMYCIILGLAKEYKILLYSEYLHPSVGQSSHHKSWS